MRAEWMVGNARVDRVGEEVRGWVGGGAEGVRGRVGNGRV